MTLRVPIVSLILVPILLATGLTAQMSRRHDVVLKNWAAPLYWQPSQTEAQAGMKPELQPGQSQAASGPLVFVAITPCRVVDTRASSGFPSGFGQPSLTSGVRRDFAIQSSTLCT